MRLSILIPTMYSRIPFLGKLLPQIHGQREDLLRRTEVLINQDMGIKSIGQKRNELLQSATGEYVVFIDCDDEISPEYLERIFEGIRMGVDHIGIMMSYEPDNGPHKLVKCSIEHKEWGEENGVYLRGAQHVCPIKREIAILEEYPNISFGEDKKYGEAITKRIKTEYLVSEPIYFYKYRSNK